MLKKNLYFFYKIKLNTHFNFKVPEFNHPISDFFFNSIPFYTRTLKVSDLCRFYTNSDIYTQYILVLSEFNLYIIL